TDGLVELVGDDGVSFGTEQIEECLENDEEIDHNINTNRTEFYKKDSFNTITAIWKMFETIKFQIFPKIIKANRKEEVMDLVEETAEKYNYFRGFIYRFAAAIIIRFSMEDAFRMIQKGWHYFSNEDEDISEGNIYTLLAIQKFNQKEYHSAYDFFMKGVSLLSRIHEINNLPEQIDIDRIKRRLAQEGHSSFALYKLGKELSSIFGQTEKTREYQKIMDFYKIE
ncbi:MAG: hypothetical protein SV062_13175, partial [Thermodesulfobacteriota bacterium]|nr:hypothetical protein [Thermodesulfobacteriota bacterium]